MSWLSISIEKLQSATAPSSLQASTVLHSNDIFWVEHHFVRSQGGFPTRHQNNINKLSWHPSREEGMHLLSTMWVYPPHLRKGCPGAMLTAGCSKIHTPAAPPDCVGGGGAGRAARSLSRDQLNRSRNSQHMDLIRDFQWT